jgi:hypothetical protein
MMLAMPIGDAMPESAKEMLTDEDLAILKLESPTVAGHTCKVLTVERPMGSAPLDIVRLRSSIDSRLALEPRMRQRLSDPSAVARLAWVDADDFDVRDHVIHYDVGRPAGRERMLDIVAELMTTRLDRSRPLWSVHLVELERDRRALVCLIHHCMADGMTAMRLASQVIWDSTGPTLAPDLRAHPAPVGAGNGKLSVRHCVTRELMPAASETPLDRHPTDERRVAVAAASLSELKRIGKQADGATVNDVVLCAVAGGLRSWLEYHGGSLAGVRVKVPVSLHDHDEHSDALGNHDSFMVIDVGTDEPEPAPRLAAISAQTRERKTMHDAQTLDHVFSDIRRISGVASSAISKWSGNPHVFTINVSNVPGPRAPIAVQGGPVSEMFTLAEIGNRHALRVAVVSLADEITFGLCADAAAVGDVDRIAAAIEADLGVLSAA